MQPPSHRPTIGIQTDDKVSSTESELKRTEPPSLDTVPGSQGQASGRVPTYSQRPDAQVPYPYSLSHQEKSQAAIAILHLLVNPFLLLCVQIPFSIYQALLSLLYQL